MVAQVSVGSTVDRRPAGREMGALPVATGFFLALVLIGAVFFVGFDGVKYLSALEILSFAATGLFAAIMLARTMAVRPISFATMIWYFGFLFLFLVPFVQAVSDRWKWFYTANTITGSILIDTNLLIFSAFIALALTYGAAHRRAASRVLRPLTYVYSWRPQGVLILFLVFACLLGIYMASTGGLTALIFRGARGEAMDLEVGVQSNVRMILAIGNNIARPGLLILALALLFLPSRGGKIGDWRKFSVVAMAVFLAAALANLPTGPARYYVSAVGFMILAWSCRGPAVRTIAVSCYLFFGVYISAVLDKFREADFSLASAFTVNREYFFVGHFNSYETIAHCIVWVQQKGISYGAELLAAFFFWVPRAIWPGKPLSPSVQFAAEYLWPNFGFAVHNVGLSTLGSFYHSFGLVGGLIFGAVAGLFAGSMDGRFDRVHLAYRSVKHQALHDFPSLTVYPIMAAAFLMFMRGQVWMGVQWLSSLAICYGLIWFFVLDRRERL